MSSTQTAAVSPSDRDLASIAEARGLARLARQAQTTLAELTQEQIDAIVAAMARTIEPHAEALARLAVDETGYGVVADKTQKNLFATTRVHEFIAPMRTVGVVARHDDTKVVEIAEPFGVVAAIVPSTNPTSTTIYKILIAIKARCAIVLSPHPSATRCITRTAEIMADAAAAAGAPVGAIGWMTTVTLEGTQELMRQRDVAVILATGGLGLVRAAYSTGKPAFGVGPGNAPCYIERTADIRKAASDILTGKTFDNGVLCSSPNSVVVDAEIAEESRRAFVAQGAYFLKDDEIERLGRGLVTAPRLPNPALVGRSAEFIAQQVGLTVPVGTRALVAPLAGVGRDFPLSIEKLSPVLSWYVVTDWRQGCERCIQILRYGGMGHTMSIHSANDDIILQFGLKKPAFRICVNTPTTHGSIGLTTGLDPAMTLGCGGWGGNSTSDNISPKHLLNIKRLAYELRPAQASPPPKAPGGDGMARPLPTAGRLPQVRTTPVAAGIAASTLAERIERFLDARGLPGRPTPPGSPTPPPESAVPSPGGAPVPFVCEDDVRTALAAGTTILIGERTIVTPAARDLGDAHRVFTQAGWPR